MRGRGHWGIEESSQLKHGSRNRYSCLEKRFVKLQVWGIPEEVLLAAGSRAGCSHCPAEAFAALVL